MSTYPDCYMCPDCGERVDEETQTPNGKCGWCGSDDKVGE